MERLKYDECDEYNVVTGGNTAWNDASSITRDITQRIDIKGIVLTDEEEEFAERMFARYNNTGKYGKKE